MRLGARGLRIAGAACVVLAAVVGPVALWASPAAASAPSGSCEITSFVAPTSGNNGSFAGDCTGASSWTSTVFQIMVPVGVTAGSTTGHFTSFGAGGGEGAGSHTGVGNGACSGNDTITAPGSGSYTWLFSYTASNDCGVTAGTSLGYIAFNGSAWSSPVAAMGTPQPLTNLGAPQMACSASLTSNGSGIASLAVTQAAQAGMAWGSVSWNPGDGTAALAGSPVNHGYTQSAEPSGGWTATATATATASSGYQFSGGATTDTVTCTAVVSFVAASTNSGPGPSSNPTSQADCVPSGWNWLNPAALVNGMGCLLQYLFVPSSQSLSDSWATFKAAFGGSFLGVPATLMGNVYDGVQALQNNYDTATVNCQGLTLSAPIFGANKPDVSVSPLSQCPNTGGSGLANPIGGGAGMVHDVLEFAIWLGTAFALVRIIAGGFGISIAPGGSGDDGRGDGLV